MQSIQGHYRGNTGVGATPPSGLPRRLTPCWSLPPCGASRPIEGLSGAGCGTELRPKPDEIASPIVTKAGTRVSQKHVQIRPKTWPGKETTNE
jgi:hypothetical protein